MKIRKNGLDWETILIFVAGVLVIVAATRKNSQTQMLVDKIASIIPSGGMPQTKTPITV